MKISSILSSKLKFISLAVFFLTVVNTVVFASDRDTISATGIRFVENKNQWESCILYKADLGHGALFLEQNCLTFCFLDADAAERIVDYKYIDNDKRSYIPSPDLNINAHAYKMNFVKCNLNAPVTSSRMTPDYNNYFIGNDESKWASRVRKYGRVSYNDIYDQIDFNIYEENGFLKYDFLIHASGRSDDIVLEYEGVNDLSIQEDNLVIKTSVNRIVELKPFAYQIVNGEKKEVACNFRLRGNKVDFRFPDGYDKTSDLIIDPVLIFSSYSGSTSDNWGYTATFDSDGFLYSGGNIFGLGYPVTIGAFQTTYGGPNCDIALSKYDTTGTFLIFSTYLGGASAEVPNSIIVDSYNNLFILGTTASANFPVTSGSYDNSYNGGTPYVLTYVLNYGGSDIVVSKLSNDGTQMLASTYFGGTGNDGLNTQAPLKYNYADDVRGEIMIDGNDNIYIVSTTQSLNLPTTPSVFQPAYSGGGQDGLIAKFDNILSNLIWCSYIGGTANDATYSIVIDDQQDIYVAGGTTSPDFPVTSGVLQPAYNGGSADGYIAHIDKNGNSIMQCTFWGSLAYDQTYFVENDKDGNIYTLGQTAASGNYWVTNAAWFITNGGQFISKMSWDLDTLIWSTAFGTGNNGPDISPTAFLVDLCDKIYLSGWGGTINPFGGTAGLPLAGTPFQATTDNNDYYFMVINDDASALFYATFFGGSISHEHVDGGTSRFDRSGRIYQSVCAGCGSNDDFPTTPGAVSNTNNSSNCNNGVIKFDFMLPLIIADFNIPPVICAPNTIVFDNTSSTGGSGFTSWWDFGDGTYSTAFEPAHTYTTSGIYYVTLAVSDTGTCNFSDTITQQVVVLSNSSDTLPSQHICITDYLQIGLLPIPDSSVSYSWLPSGTLSDPYISNPFAYPNQTTQYTLLISNGLCTDTLTQTVNVYNLDAYIGQDTTTCSGIILLTANSSGGASSFQWSDNPLFSNWLNSGPSDSTMTATISGPTTFYIQVSNAWCTVTDSITVNFSLIAGSGLLSSPSCNGYCDGSASVSIGSGNAPFTYLWSNGSTNDTIFNVCAGTYIVTIADSAGCISIVNIVLIDPPAIILTPEPINIPCTGACIGGITLQISGGSPPYSYTWSNGMSGNPIGGLCEGIYYVSVTDTEQCLIYDSASITVDWVFINADAWVDDDTIYSGQTTQVHSTPINGCTYQWTPATGLEDPSASSTEASPESTTMYIITITDPSGCIFLDTVYIVVLDVFCDEPYIYVPNAFTPDGDNVNDILYVRSNVLAEIFFTIYDRWGEKVFETTTQDKGWDGNFRGMKCDPGVFVYYLEVTCYNRQTFFKKGNITLIR